MGDLQARIEALDSSALADSLNDKGYALVPGLLPEALCQELIAGFEAPQGYRKTVVMERYRFGQGLYKYWSYPLPASVQVLRQSLYPKLQPLANAWGKALGLDWRFPVEFQGLSQACAAQGQALATPLILRYGPGGYNTLHQDIYGEVYFPLQAAFVLNQRDRDFTGGEFVLTQQVPRAQSKATVLTPNQGDMLIFPSNFRPIKGSRGYYRATMKHGVSEVTGGQRYAMGVIFHDATS